MRPTVILLILFIVSISVVWTLKHFYGSLSVKMEPFERRFISQEIPVKASFQIPGDPVRIGGSSPEHIYFQTDHPSLILDFNIGTKEFKTLQLPVPANTHIKLEPILVTIESSFAQILLPRHRGVININRTTQVGRFFAKPGNSFIKGILIDSICTLVLELDKRSQNERFTLWNGRTDSLEDFKTDLPNFHDGGIRVDGNFSIDQQRHHACYVCAYECLFVIFDLQRKISIEAPMLYKRLFPPQELQNDFGATASQVAPYELLHTCSCIWDNRLFVCSQERANPKDFGSFDIIDVYELPKGQYAGSFKLETSTLYPPSNMAVINDSIYLEKKDRLYVYDLPQRF